MKEGHQTCAFVVTEAVRDIVFFVELLGLGFWGSLSVF